MQCDRNIDCSYKWCGAEGGKNGAFLVRLFGFVASDCNHTWKSGFQDADQPLCAFDAVRDGEQCEGNVDLSAALPPVLLPVAVHSHVSLAHLQRTGKEANT